jgi:hypothetical protein
MTLTLEIPDDLASRLLTVPEKERHNFALAALRTCLDEDNEVDEEEIAMDSIPEILLRPAPDAIKKALADLDEGKGIDGKILIAELRAPFQP